jgi:hypothetical protein
VSTWCNPSLPEPDSLLQDDPAPEELPVPLPEYQV